MAVSHEKDEMKLHAATVLASILLWGGFSPENEVRAPIAEETTRLESPASSRQADRSAYWERSGRNVLAGFRNMYHATVLQVSSTDLPDAVEHPYRMWFMGRAAHDGNPGFAGCDAIFHARGTSLEEWEVYCGNGAWDRDRSPEQWVPVVTAQDKPYDSWHNGDPSVVFHKGRFYMAYSATGPNLDGHLVHEPEDADGDLLCVMGAESEDGIRWRRSRAPLVMYEPEVGAPHEPKTGAFKWGMYHRPSLLFDRGRWRLWFDYWTGLDVAMGYAEAPEEAFLEGRFEVLYADDRPLLHEWPNPSVIKVGTIYRSFADPSGYGIGWAGRQLAEAESADGIHWRILGYLPSDRDTPACHVPSATLVAEKGVSWLVVFYACQIGGDPYDYRYDRIRYMKQRVAPVRTGNNAKASRPE